MKIRLVAETPYDRARGLMFSKPLARDEIAIFKFAKSTGAGFWNVNVSYPIKIAFFDENFNLVGLQSMKAEQVEMVRALKPYKYAVEMADVDSDSMMLVDIKNYLKQNYGNKL